MTALAVGACNNQSLESLPNNFVETHVQSGQAPQVDVLFMVDNSHSMTDDQTYLAAGFESFIPYLKNAGLDYHISIITSDMGPGDLDDDENPGAPTTLNNNGMFQSVPKVMTTATTNLEAVFTANAVVGDNGSSLEQGMAAIEASLSDPLLHGYNAGFLRPNAVLAIVAISNEDDHSLSPTGTRSVDETQQHSAAWQAMNLNPVQHYIDFLTNLKGGNKGLLSVSALVVKAGTCANDSNSEVGHRWLSLSTSLNGVQGDICQTNYGPVLSQVGQTIVGLQSQFELGYSPESSTLVVSVNGVPVPEGPNTWTYNSATNVVTFSGADLPPSCSTVTFSYQVTGYGNTSTTPTPQPLPAQLCPGEAPPTNGAALNGGELSCAIYRIGAPGEGLMASVCMALGAGLMFWRRRTSSPR